MSQLIRLIGRSALVALGLTAGFQVQAAQVVVDIPTCNSFSWNPSSSTLSCNTNKCVISGPATSTPGTSITLNAECAGATTISWSGSTAVGACSGSSCAVNESTTGTRNYVATSDLANSASTAYPVNWSNTPVTQPGGCSLTATPTSGTSATSVTLTVNCTSGSPIPINVSWAGGAAAPGCPTQFNIGDSAAARSCTINGVASNTTWNASFSNAGGQATSPSNPRVATFTYNAGGGGGGFANCPAGSETLTYAWRNAQNDDRVVSSNFNTNILSIRVTIPAGTSFPGGYMISAVEYQSGLFTRDFALSTKACSFEVADALKTKNGLYAAIQNANVSPSLPYGVIPNAGYYTAPSDGSSFYINMRNASCPGSCNVAVTIRD